MRYLAKLTVAFALMGIVALLHSCGLFGLSGGYSFTGAQIPPTAQTFSIGYINNNSSRVLATLSNALTEALTDRFVRQTRLSQVAENGDLAFEGEITDTTDAPSSIAATNDGMSDGAAAMNRLTVTVQIRFTNVLQPEWSFTSPQTFSAFADYDATQSFPSMEAALIEEIVTALVDNIFNASVAQW